MSDFHPDDTFLRASAYLDGELDAAEMALAEADPAVMAEVELLRALQDSVRDVEPPAAGARERAIDAALAEFDALQPASSVVAFRPRPAYTRWLAVAAAVVGVGLLGVIVATTGSGGDDDDADRALDAAAESLSTTAEADAGGSSPAAPLPESLAGGDEATVFEANADDADIADDAEAAPATDAPQATEAPAATALAAEATTSAAGPPFDLTAPIPDEVTLGIVGRQLLEQADEQSTVTSARNTSDTACDEDAAAPTILAEASYLRDGVAIPILIAVDATTAKIVAVDPATCEIVAVEP